MVIFNQDGIIVRQHQFLEYYQVEQWDTGIALDHTVKAGDTVQFLNQLILTKYDRKF